MAETASVTIGNSIAVQVVCDDLTCVISTRQAANLTIDVVIVRQITVTRQCLLGGVMMGALAVVTSVVRTSMVQFTF